MAARPPTRTQPKIDGLPPPDALVSGLGRPGRAPNDIDVFVIGSPDREAVDDAAERAERTIGLPVQATVRSRSQWAAGRDSFIQEVKSRPLVAVLADDDLADELPRAAHSPELSA